MDKTVFLFAGQGSQYIGMGKDLYDSFPESKLVFDKANQVLGFSLTDLIFNGTADALKLTINSQPAILTVSIAAYEAFKAKIGIKPVYVAGLSLGEYSALIAAGAFSFEDGLMVVRKRAEIMEEATHRHPGTMAAVLDLPLDKIREICLKTSAEVANINAPGQIVISGKKEAINQAVKLCNEAGAKRVIELEVSGAFHSSLMLDASAELGLYLKDVIILDPSVPVISNYTAVLQSKAAEIRENLVKQMHSSVRWEESMHFALSNEVSRFFEFGPGKVLKGLMRRIDSNAQVVNIEKKDDVLSLS